MALGQQTSGEMNPLTSNDTGGKSATPENNSQAVARCSSCHIYNSNINPGNHLAFQASTRREGVRAFPGADSEETHHVTGGGRF